MHEVDISFTSHRTTHDADNRPYTSNYIEYKIKGRFSNKKAAEAAWKEGTKRIASILYNLGKRKLAKKLKSLKPKEEYSKRGENKSGNVDFDVTVKPLRKRN